MPCLPGRGRRRRHTRDRHLSQRLPLDEPAQVGPVLLGRRGDRRRSSRFFTAYSSTVTDAGCARSRGRCHSLRAVNRSSIASHASASRFGVKVRECRTESGPVYRARNPVVLPVCVFARRSITPKPLLSSAMVVHPPPDAQVCAVRCRILWDSSGTTGVTPGLFLAPRVPRGPRTKKAL